MSHAAPAPADKGSFSGLVRWLLQSGNQPLDAPHVAATLELNGWTDRRALTLGYESVFELSEALFATVMAAPRRETALAEPARIRWYALVWNLIRLYLRGLSFAAPMLLSSAAVLRFRYSLWSWVGFSTEQATAIAMGTFASFLVAGGFTQAVARRGLFYISQDQFGLAKQSSLRLIRAGIVATLLFAGVVVGGILLIPLFPWHMIGIMIAYFLPLTFIWLGTTLLYMLHREPLILVLVGAGIALVYALTEWARLEMMLVHVVSMSAVAIGAFGSGLFYLRRLEETNAKESGLRERVRWSQLSRLLAPFFLYGMAYFCLMFIDRMVAWSRPAEFHPYFIWFRGDYELGLDWALWTLVLPMGVVEIYVAGLYKRLAERSRTTPIDRLAPFHSRFQREHRLVNWLVLGTGCVGLPLIVQATQWLHNIGLLPVTPLATPQIRLVFFVAAPAFSALAVGLQSVLVLYSLNELWMPVRAAAIALLVDILVGFLATRYGFLTHAYAVDTDYADWAVFGLLAGTVLFAVLTTRAALRVLGRADYYLLRGT